MAGSADLRVSTEEIASIASEMNSLNEQLCSELDSSKNSVNKLADFWEGQASEATISSFNAFYQKFYSTYKELIDKYVKFLRTQVDEAGVSTEKQVSDLSNAFTM